MMAITTSSSISVNPDERREKRGLDLMVGGEGRSVGPSTAAARGE
jgi:hypothetical protein